jgi:hypothetical protein
MVRCLAEPPKGHGAHAVDLFGAKRRLSSQSAIGGSILSLAAKFPSGSISCSRVKTSARDKLEFVADRKWKDGSKSFTENRPHSR